MYTLLAIDTSSKACSVALTHHQKTYQIITLAERQQTRQILSQIQAILTHFNLTIAQIDALVFSRGPGSFTGIRLAASVMQGLAWGAHLPVVAVSTLHTIAQGLHVETGATKIAVATEAYGGKIYWGLYQLDVQENRVVAVSPDKMDLPENVSLADSEDWIGVGDGWVAHKEKLLARLKMKALYEDYYPQAKYVVELGLIDFLADRQLAPQDALPVYLYGAEYWKKTK